MTMEYQKIAHLIDNAQTSHLKLGQKIGLK